jgi:hypothetical protein
VVLLNLEVGADHLSLAQAQEILYRFGRAYPAGWEPDGSALHCMASVEWLGADGRVLASSDAQQREAFLQHVAQHRAPRISSHWAYLMQPLVTDTPTSPARCATGRSSTTACPSWPTCRWTIRAASRATTSCGWRWSPARAPADAHLPYADHHLADFEHRYCYDRFWVNAGAAPNTRYLCNGHALVVVGDAQSEFFCCRDRGVLAQFGTSTSCCF